MYYLFIFLPKKIAPAVLQLAIVNMSDQYTRVTCGGTPLPKRAPVVGLLFGKELAADLGSSTTAAAKTKTASSAVHRLRLQVTDAEDIPVDSSDAAAMQVSLHRAVFPQHAVVGWYRVASSSSSPERTNAAASADAQAQPTAEDLVTTQKLQLHYRASSGDNTESGTPSSSSSSSLPFLFALLQAPSTASAPATKPAAKGSAPEDEEGKLDDQDDDDDDDLPLTLYKVCDGAGGEKKTSAAVVLRALDDWKLETSDSERIAVERVMREKQPRRQQRQGGGGGGSGSASSNEKADGPQQKQQSPFVHASQELQHSLAAIDARLEVVASYLQETIERQRQDPDFRIDHGRIRRINSLLLQYQLLGTSPSSSSGGREIGDDSTSSIQQLAFLAKALNAVQSYADKVKLVHDAPGGRERHFAAGRGGGGGTRGDTGSGGGLEREIRGRYQF